MGISKGYGDRGDIESEFFIQRCPLFCHRFSFRGFTVDHNYVVFSAIEPAGVQERTLCCLELCRYVR